MRRRRDARRDLEDLDVVAWVICTMWMDGELDKRPNLEQWMGYARYDAWRQQRKHKGTGASAGD